MTDRKRVCCNCGRNKRIEDDTGEIRCYCELDNHYIDYVENFEHWCRRWTKESGRKAVEQMKVVRKKILPKYFKPVNMCEKNFELRKDEDNVQVGDVIILREHDGTNFTGRRIARTVKYVLRNVPEYGLMDGYCIIGW